MQPDSRRLADTASWLRKASNDLRYAGIDLAAEPAASEDAVFHCQQAVEKALKAFFVWSDVPFPDRQSVERSAICRNRLGGRAGRVRRCRFPLPAGGREGAQGLFRLVRCAISQNT